MLRLGEIDSPQGLKPNVFNACCGTTKVVPFQNSFMRPALKTGVLKAEC